MKYKLAILTSHPIQYQAPLFRKLSAHPQIDLTVYFCSDRGVTETIDPGFGVTFKWDVPLLEGYRHKFLQANHAGGRAPRRARQSIPARLIMDLRNNHYDAIVLHGYTLPANYVAYLAAWLTKTPVIFRGETILRNEQPLWQKAAKRVLLTWLFRHTGAFLPIGTKSWEFYRHYGVAEDRWNHDVCVRSILDALLRIADCGLRIEKSGTGPRFLIRNSQSAICNPDGDGQGNHYE